MAAPRTRVTGPISEILGLTLLTAHESNGDSETAESPTGSPTRILQPPGVRVRVNSERGLAPRVPRRCSAPLGAAGGPVRRPRLPFCISCSCVLRVGPAAAPRQWQSGSDLSPPHHRGAAARDVLTPPLAHDVLAQFPAPDCLRACRRRCGERGARARRRRRRLDGSGGDRPNSSRCLSRTSAPRVSDAAGGEGAFGRDIQPSLRRGPAGQSRQLRAADDAAQATRSTSGPERRVPGRPLALRPGPGQRPPGPRLRTARSGRSGGPGGGLPWGRAGDSVATAGRGAGFSLRAWMPDAC